MFLLVSFAIAGVINSNKVAYAVAGSIRVATLEAVVNNAVVSGSLPNSAVPHQGGLVGVLVEGKFDIVGQFGFIQNTDVGFEFIKTTDLDKLLFLLAI